MVSISGDESTQWDTQGSSAHDEKIFVAVRLRPLNDKEEAARNDESEWECINNNTIMHKNGLQERSMFPTAYTFEYLRLSALRSRFMRRDPKKLLFLSVVNGINSSIFAYGQTSSGKTYTMCGITEYAMADIYDYILQQNDREFVLKFSAMEIYNESVRDLLGSDSTPLRLLDDPERGTVVEKLTEVALRDWRHLKELLAVCKAERQLGETSLNEMSSRSHQIIRLTVASSALDFLGAENSSTLAATMNFVDLAGSERASQNLSAGSRLKEGCHINRSLLTLGTVIRKLSKGKNGHVPFRDSKLTRILQNSLGGNARTAIICTMSPAHCHVEQSRNTLLFAMCAKQVSTNAQVNVVMSEKALVKQLQRELARLENELRSSASISGKGDSASLLKEKERLIEKMDSEIRDLTLQRDIAQSRVQEMLRSTGDNQVSRTWVEVDQLSDTHEKSSWQYENSLSDSTELPDNSEEHFLSDGSSPSEFMNKYFGPDLSRGWEEITQKNYESSEDNCKEVRCIEIEPSMDENIKTAVTSSPHKGDGDLGHTHSDDTHEASKQKIQDMQTTVDDGYISPNPVEPTPCSLTDDVSDSKSINLVKSKSYRAVVMTMSSPPLPENTEQDAITNEVDIDLTSKACKSNPEANSEMLLTKDPQDGSDSMDEKEQNTKTTHEDDTDCATGLGENLKYGYEMKLGDNTVQEPEPNQNGLMKIVKDGDDLDKVHGPQNSSSDWSLEFERQRKEIIQLWDSCYIPLVHRTYFFLVFQGDQSDSVYMEVEFRRLSFLMQTIPKGTSSRALNCKRGMLSRQILRKFSKKEREALYQKWSIDLKSKNRRQQLCRRLWKDTENMEHIKESAALVAKLVGEPGQAPKEIFGLSFVPQHSTLVL